MITAAQQRVRDDYRQRSSQLERAVSGTYQALVRRFGLPVIAAVAHGESITPKMREHLDVIQSFQAYCGAAASMRDTTDRIRAEASRRQACAASTSASDPRR